MFGFQKKTESIIDKQVADLKATLDLLLDENGEARPGVTSEQIKSATKTVSDVTAIYNKINKEERAILAEQKAINVEIDSLKQRVVDADLTNVVRSEMSLTAALLGL